MIELQGVEFQYPRAHLKTLEISKLKIEKGERVFLFGPSGSGKSTLLEILAGVLVPQKGSVRILNQKLETLNSAQRDQFRSGHLGYIFQSFNLIPYLSVEENILLPLSFSPLRRERLQGKSPVSEVEHLCHRLGILNLRQRKVTELSVGQQQRVAVARALLGNPEIILADEPTSSLDHDHREKFIQLLFQICEEKNTTLLFVSHDRSLEKLFSRSLSLLDINQVRAL
ncbi:MAG: ABC transporter ATP-binding protein [Pseudobdellovibrionaceae bacterium]